MTMEGDGIPVFDGEGYEIWSKKMMTLFISRELWDLVQKGYGEEATDMGLGEKRKNDCKALYMIQQGVSNHIFPVIIKANTSKEAWEAIRDRFHHDQQQQIQEIEEEEMHSRRTTIRMEKMVSKLSPIYRERCIYRVPDALRFGNEEFYEPKVLSIGPYHRGKPRLAFMEEHKIRYLKQLLEQGDQSMDNYVQAVKPHEERVRKCYAESIDNVSSDDLIQMLVLDGCFIIELLRKMENRRDQYYRWFQEREKLWNSIKSDDEELIKDDHVIKSDVISSNELIKDDPVINSEAISSNELIKDDQVINTDAIPIPSEELIKDIDPVINSDVLLNGLQNDLLLVENQIPFFIIENLYGVISHNGDHSRIKKLNTLILAFLCRKYLVYELFPQKKIIIVRDICHLLDITHKTLCPPIEEYEVERNSDVDETFCFVDSATKLEEANVKLKFKKSLIISNIFDITFSHGKLTIPCFDINYQLEVDIRNFIALELCQQNREKRYFCDYVVFMDHLIASPDDVKLLIHRGIITNQMIDVNFVDNMFKRLTRNIVTSDPYTYYQISKELNIYCERTLNKWCASFMQKYCKSPWTFISVLAASMLLVLTITQTVYSILSYHK